MTAMERNSKKRLSRFLRYVKIDTQSDDSSDSVPSTAKQFELLNLLRDELLELGISDAFIDEYGRLYAHLPGEEGVARIGLNSHVDTAREASGKDVKPIIHEDYDGKDIVLPKNGTIIKVDDFPRLKEHVGDTIVTTDGSTLLGGDDKAGIAIIMNVLEEIVREGKKHHPISILFTPDEEIGKGADYFDNEKFGADFAYTIDGSEPDLVECENFNAAHAWVSVKGVAIHPGEAKGKLINAITMIQKLDLSLGISRRPETTEGREGFYHLILLEGTSSEARAEFLIREHDRDKFEAMKKELLEKADALEKSNPGCKFSVRIEDDYRNMKEVLEKDPRALLHAKKAFESLGLPMRENAIRGGTDGSNFSFKGCPCPNLGTGSYNHHGEKEYLSLNDFDTMVEIVKKIVTLEIE